MNVEGKGLNDERERALSAVPRQKASHLRGLSPVLTVRLRCTSPVCASSPQALGVNEWGTRNPYLTRFERNVSPAMQ